MLIEISSLIPHPLAQSLVPRMTELEFQALLEDIKKNGIIDPIEVIPDKKSENKYLIIDGIHRFTAAKELNLKKIPVIIKNISEDKIKEYVLSKAIMRRNISRTQRAVLAVEWILSNDIHDNSSKEASRKFAVPENIILTVLEIKNFYPNIYNFLKKGSLDYKSAVELINSQKQNSFSIIEEFKDVSDEIKELLKKIPVSVQQILYNEIFVKQEKNDQDIKNDIIEKITEKNLLIQELTNNYYTQKKKAEELEKKYKELSREEKKLKKLVHDLQYLVNDLYKKQNSNFVIDKPQKFEVLEIISEINNIKEKLNQLENLKLKKNEKLNEEDIKKISEIYTLFSFFSSVFSEYNISKLYNLLKDINYLNLSCINQINYFFNQLEKFLDMLQKSLYEKIENYKSDITEEKKFLVLKIKQ